MKHLAAGLLLFCWLPLWGQVTNLHFTNLSIDAGLSDKMVFAVAQDSTGLMWFGTAEGLNRYDGYNFETFRYNPGDSTSVSASFINCIHLTRTGELWIGTEKGLDLYDPVTESFVKYHADNDSLRLLNNLRIRCIHDDPQGVMWVGTLEGLIRLDLRKRYINYFVLVPDAFDRMANEIRSICADRHGMLWLGTFDGLYRFNPTDNSFVRYETRSRKLPNDTYNNLVNALYIPENTPDLLYVGSSSGLVVLDIRHPEQPLGTLRAEDGGLTDNDIKSILSYDDTHLLLATADGLTLYDTRSCRASAYYSSLSDPTSLPNNSLRTLFRDRQNIVWIGTDSGLAKLDLKRKKIDCVRLTNDRKGAERKVIVNDLLGTPDHSLWLTTNEGVLRYDSTRRDAGYTRYMADKGVSHSIAKRLIRDSHGTLWLGTNDGIDYYDAARDRFVRAEHSNQNFSLKYIYDIKEDADHDIVTNISSGLCFITPHYRPDGGISHLSYKTRLISGIINSDNCDIGYFDVDAKGNIWFAATQEGLFKYEKRNDRFVQYKVRTDDPRSLISNRIYTIHVDRKGNVWTGTDRGLCKLDPASGLFERFDNDLDLSQSIRTLTSDSRGRIWAATTNKLIMYDPVRKNKIVCDLNRDLRIDELIYNSFFIDPQGHIYMGGDGGYIRYHPDAILLNEDKAPTVVTSFSLWNKEVRPGHRIGKRVALPRSILHSDRLRLRHNENSFRFYFSLLNFASSNNKYAYRLEGYDKEWQMTGGTQNYAAYSNLSPGRYLFTVRGCNSDGIWSDRTARIEVRILPPWWLSWWAYLIYGVLVAVVIVVAYNLTLTKMKLLSELRLEKLERMKTEELNQVKMRFFTNVSHEFKTPLSLILGPIESLGEQIRDKRQLEQLSLMRQNGERLLRLIDQIMDLRKFDNGKMKLNPSTGEFVSFVRRIYASFAYQAQRRGIDYDFETSEPELTFQFDSDKVEKVLYNLLSNAFKFTPDNGHIGITVSLRRSDEGRFAAVEVSDTGIGVTEADREHIFERFYQGSNPSFESIRGTGIGLMLAKDFVELHGGTLTLESAPGRGSAFTFTLPVDPAGAAPASGTAERQPEAGSAERNPKVLIVEDNEDMRNFLRINLEEQYEIYAAHDGNDGWEQIRNIYPDLVVSDVMMPGMDGFELCRRSKAELLTCHIPFLLLTAKSDEENRAEGYSAGADGYIAKPFSIKTLRTRVNSLIEQRIKLRERYRQKLLTDPSEIQIESENDKFIDTLVKAIEQNIDNSEFGIQELCEISRYSYQQVYRKVKALTGESINEFIRTVRLKRAAQYLAQSDTRISEIMYSVGFNSHSYFTKCFREHFGLSPKEYAEKHRRK